MNEIIFFPFIVFKQQKELEGVINIISIYLLGFVKLDIFRNYTFALFD